MLPPSVSTSADANQLSLEKQSSSEPLAQIGNLQEFQAHMQQLYGEEVFEPGFEIVKGYRQQAFAPDGANALHGELAQLIADERVRKNFI